MRTITLFAGGLMIAEGPPTDAVKEFVYHLTITLLRQGYTLNYSCNPHLDPVINRARASVRGGQIKAFALEPHPDPNLIPENHPFASQRFENLTMLREALAKNCDVAVFVGGDTFQQAHNRQRCMPGMIVELSVFCNHRAGNRAFIVTGFGGNTDESGFEELAAQKAATRVVPTHPADGRPDPIHAAEDLLKIICDAFSYS